ncbi:MAG: aspartate-semialdehyde dehydrogenase [Sphingomonadales bacterium]|nr:aspartate-semialdehyde dehydrogenase [Sphingomonadales bacterium]MBD3773362.1 aspartate-semialdehyde dehydrogenase [Paracoccaceae bacterium]
MRFILPFLALACTACNPAGNPPDPAKGEAAAPTGTAAPVALADGALNAGGISIAGAKGDIQVAFGTARAAAEVALVPLLGEPKSRDHNDECGAGPMDFSHYGTLTLNFQDDKFVGWSANGAPWLPGETRGDLAAQVKMQDDSTLGEEFVMGEGNAIVSGLFDGEGAGAKVTDLWAGTGCIFR